MPRARALHPDSVSSPAFPTRRLRLTYDTFSAFLAAIKDLNCGRATRAQMLAAAAALLGGDSELYARFEGLLARHSGE